VIRYLSVEEKFKLLETMRSVLSKEESRRFKTFLRDYVAILLGTECGLRSGESLKLRISDVWFEGKPKEWLEIPAGFNKNCVAGIIPLSDKLAAALREYVPLRSTWLKEGAADGPLLVSRPGVRGAGHSLSRVTLHAVVHFWAKKAGIEPFKYHSLRHTFGTTMMRGDKANLATVQSLMRHRSIGSTGIYLHPGRSEFKDLVGGTLNKEDGGTVARTVSP